jgi:hypothetical protein
LSLNTFRLFENPTSYLKKIGVFSNMAVTISLSVQVPDAFDSEKCINKIKTG